MKASAGKPYTFGGKTTAGFDCSGFVTYVFKQVFSNFVSVDTNDIQTTGFFTLTTSPQPGDVIFFPKGTNPYEVKKGNKKEFPNHVGIVIDQASWIGSQSSTGVAIVKTTNPWFAARITQYYKYSQIGT
jgi:cell wall-associated NlpC family hydrolase